MAKTSLWRIPYDHFRTLTNYNTGRPQVGDYLIQVGAPIAVGAFSGLAGARLKDVSGAVAGVSIVAGLLFSMAVFLFQLRISLPNDKRLGQQDLDLVDQCMKNVLWAILLGLSLSFYLVIGGAGSA